jgi:serine/threonine protein kinase
VHRDVKPKNILLTPDGQAKLTDLGLARDVDDKVAAESEAGKAYGTPYYISPEQIRGEIDIDFRADIYSLGATLYHLLTGRPPFEGETPSAVMHKHLKDALVPPDHLVTNLSSGIAEIIEHSMAKRREDRYMSTTDMLEDLRAVRDGRGPVHARQHLNIDSLASIAPQRAKTVDIVVQPSIWENPAFVAVVVIAGLSIVANLVLLAVSIM